MTTERVDIIVSEKGAVVVKRNIDDIATSSDRADRSVTNLRRNLERFSGGNIARSLNQVNAANESVKRGLDQVAIGYNQAATGARNLNRSQRDAIGGSRALSTALIATGASARQAGPDVSNLRAALDFSSIGGAGGIGGGGRGGFGGRFGAFFAGISADAKKARFEVVNLRNAIAVVIGIAVIRRVVQLADAYTNLQNRIRVVAGETADLAQTTDDLFAIANRTRVQVQSVAQVYQQLSIAASELNLSQNELLRITETLNQALVVSGGAGESGRAALIQLTQGLAQGTLRGQELLSVLEQLPIVADLIADRLGVGRGALKALAEEGAITSQIVVEAVQQGEAALAESFGETVPTITQSLNIFNNELLRYVGQTNEATGASRVLSQAIIFLAENLNILATALLAVGAAMLIAFGRVILVQITAVTLALKRLFILILANPLVALAAALAAATIALVAFKDEISVTSDETVKLGDLFKAVFDPTPVEDTANAIDDLLVTAVRRAGRETEEAFSFETLATNVAKGITGIFPVLRAFDSTLTLFVGRVQFRITNAIKRALNVLVEEINSLLDKIPNVIKEKIGIGNDFQIDPFKIFEENGKTAGKDFGEAFDVFLERELTKTLSEGGTAFQAVQGFFDQARFEARIRRGANVPLRPKPQPPGSADNTITDKELESLRELQGRLFPVIKAQQDLAEVTDFLATIRDKEGIPAAIKVAELEERINFILRDQLDPLAAVNRSIAEQTRLAKLSNEERAIESELLRLTKSLQESGVVVTDKVVENLREQLTNLQQINKETQLQQQLLDQIKGPQKEFNDLTRATNQLLKDGKISAEEARVALRDLRIEFLESQTSAAAGFERGLLKAQRDLEDFAASAEMVLTNAFSNAQDAFTEFLNTGKLSFKSFINGLIQDLNRLAVQQVFAQLFGATGIFGSLVGGASGLLGGLFGGVSTAGASVAAGVGGGSAAQAVGGGVRLPAFASGGSFMVNRNTSLGTFSGVDNRLVAFRAMDGERVTVSRRGQSQAPSVQEGDTVNVTVMANDLESFRQSPGQVQATAFEIGQRANRRNR